MSAGAPPPNGPPPEEQPTVYQETVVEPPAYVAPEPPVGPPIEPGPPMLPPEEPPPSRELWPWLVLLIVLVAGGLLAAYLLTRNDNNNGQGGTGTTAIGTTGTVSTTPTGGVIVPSVVGMKQAAAQARLQALGLKSQVRKQPSTRPAGTVLAQNPAAGARLRRGALVGLTVSAGPPAGAVPDVVGLTAAEAAAKLQAAGFQVTVRKIDAQKPAGTVVSQTPPAGSNLKKGGAVTLAVSNGPPDVTVPDVVGLKRVQAEKKLRTLGFTVKIHGVPSQQPPGTVVAQHPRPGATAKKGSRVRLNVSNGPSGVTSGGGTSPTPTGTTPTSTSTTPSSKVAVPDVTGEDERQATSDLESAGFQVATQDQAVTDQTQDGIVLDQHPAGGTQARRGSTVTITVGRFSG